MVVPVLGRFLAFLSPRNQTLADRLAGTIVVRTSRNYRLPTTFKSGGWVER